MLVCCLRVLGRPILREENKQKCSNREILRLVPASPRAREVAPMTTVQALDCRAVCSSHAQTIQRILIKKHHLRCEPNQPRRRHETSPPPDPHSTRIRRGVQAHRFLLCIKLRCCHSSFHVVYSSCTMLSSSASDCVLCSVISSVDVTSRPRTYESCLRTHV